MKFRHLLRSGPTDLIRNFIDEASKDKDSKEVALFEEPVDYDSLIEDIFESERVIAWW